VNALTKQYRVIDVDTHIIEPYDLWTSRVSRKFADRVPLVKWNAQKQEDEWYFNGVPIHGAASAAMAGWPEFPPNHPKRFEDLSPSIWRAEDRLKKMDEYGVYAQVLYPNIAGFGAGKYLCLEDPELMLQCVQAYNDWVAEWAKADPKRLLPQAALPFWDIELARKEMVRAKKLGHRGVVFSNDPTCFGQAKLSDPAWDPLWAAAQEMELPVNFHIGSGDPSPFELVHPSAGKHAAFASLPILFTLDNARAIVSIILSGVCHRFPKLKFVSVESGVGWIPFALDTMDWQWINSGASQEHPEYNGMLPSDYFKRQFYACFWFERKTLHSAIRDLGADNLLYETDFPHPTSMSPGPASSAQAPADYIQETMADLPSDVVRKLLHDNAVKVYNLAA
jgi:uncharacterized protein